MATVMYDYDGVKFPFSRRFKKWAEQREGRKLPSVGTWHFYRPWGWTDAHFVEMLGQFAEEGGFAEGKPLPGALGIDKFTRDLGHSVVVVTDRPTAAHADTIAWTQKWFPETEDIMFSRDKTVFMDGRKGPFLAVDDRIENVENMRKVGIEAYLLTRPWNLDSSLPRVNHLDGFRVVLESAKAREDNGHLEGGKDFKYAF